MSVVPRGMRGSPAAIFGSAMVGAFLGGNAWYWGSIFDLFEGSWPPVALGLFIAITTRVGGGGTDTGLRAGLATTVYGLTVFTVLASLTYRAQLDIYGFVDDWAQYEQALVRSHLRETVDLVAYGLGAAAAWFTSIALRKR